jgi:MSHA biogenesis protein MshE
MHFKTGAGCTYCNLSGYRGRMAVYELLEIDRGLADAIRRGDLTAFAEGARARPLYVSLAQGALQIAAKGQTSLAEAIGVTSGIEEREEPKSSLMEDARTEQVLHEARA